MKKLAILIATVIIICFVASSCSTGGHCAAYGESYKYQKQQNF